MENKKIIQMKMNDGQYELIESVSKFAGTSKASFVRAASLEKARDILKSNSEVRPLENDSKL